MEDLFCDIEKTFNLFNTTITDAEIALYLMQQGFKDYEITDSMITCCKMGYGKGWSEGFYERELKL